MATCTTQGVYTCGDQWLGKPHYTTVSTVVPVFNLTLYIDHFNHPMVYEVSLIEIKSIYQEITNTVSLL